MTHLQNDIQTKKNDQAPVAILGFGVAGFNTAVGLRLGGYEGVIEVFSDLDTNPYSPIMTSYYAAGMIAYEDCFPWTQDEIDRLDLIVHKECPVERIDNKAHTIHTAQGVFTYSKCVIATGAIPAVFGFDPDSPYAPIVLHSMEQAERLRSVLSDPDCKKVLISGASMIAVKMLEAALIAGKECTLVGMNSHILDMTAFPPAAARFQQKLAEQGVRFRFDQTISDVSFQEAPDHPRKHILQVTFSDGESDSFDEILVAHGLRCDLSLLDGGAVEKDKGILVDRFMRTSCPDIYAAGDVAQALELISQTQQIVGIWKNAAEQGLCAGKTIAAELTGNTPSETYAFSGSISSNTISCNGPLFISAGSHELTDERYIETVEDEDMTIVYLYEGEQLVGFNICADEDIEGSKAYELGGMLTRQILESIR